MNSFDENSLTEEIERLGNFLENHNLNQFIYVSLIGGGINFQKSFFSSYVYLESFKENFEYYEKMMNINKDSETIEIKFLDSYRLN